jgi:HEAT repeat protein
LTELRTSDDPRAEAALFEALGDANPFVRQCAARTLVQRDPGRPVEPLLERLRRAAGSDATGPLSAQELARFWLSGLKSIDAVGMLVAELESRDPRRRADAAFGLGQTGDEAALAPMLRAAEDPDPEVRAATIGALRVGCFRGGNETFPALEAAGDDPDPRLRRAATRPGLDVFAFDPWLNARAEAGWARAARVRGRLRRRTAAGLALGLPLVAVGFLRLARRR